MNSLTESHRAVEFPSAWLEISGDDADTFLQSQFTRDLRAIPPEGVYGLWLDHRGRIVADSIVRKLAASQYQIFSYYSPADTIRATLEKHIIADDVELLDRSHEAVLLVYAASDPIAGQLVDKAIWNLPAVRLGDSHRECLVAKQDADTLNFIADNPAPLNTESLRIRNGFFRIPTELDAEHSPADAGLASAVSLDKGCFLGQEVVARTLRLGRAIWQPALFQSKTPFHPSLPLPVGEPIQAKITSWSNTPDGGIGLGLMKSKYAESLREVDVISTDSTVHSLHCQPMPAQ